MSEDLIWYWGTVAFQVIVTAFSLYLAKRFKQRIWFVLLIINFGYSLTDDSYPAGWINYIFLLWILIIWLWRKYKKLKKD